MAAADALVSRLIEEAPTIPPPTAEDWDQLASIFLLPTYYSPPSPLMATWRSAFPEEDDEDMVRDVDAMFTAAFVKTYGI